MAPRKEDSKKSKDDDGATLVLDYLRKQNRPYSVVEISSNLHNKVTKAGATKYLKEMHDRKQVESRVSGKQVVYHSIQPEVSTSASEDLAELDEKQVRLQDSLSLLKSQEKSLKTELASLSSFRSLDELNATVKALIVQKQGLLERLEELKTTANNVKPVSLTQFNKVNEDLKSLRKHHSKRRCILRDMWIHAWDVYCNKPSDDERMTDVEFWQDEIGGDGDIPAKL